MTFNRKGRLKKALNVIELLFIFGTQFEATLKLIVLKITNLNQCLPNKIALEKNKGIHCLRS